MAQRQWTQSYEIGHAVIDEQHKNLLGLLDELENMMARREDGDKTVATCMAFRELLEKHSIDEEEILRQADFPGLPGHMDEHVKVMERMKEVFSGCGEACRAESDGPCLEDLSHHMLDHIIRLDLGFKSHLQMKNLTSDRR